MNLRRFLFAGCFLVVGSFALIRFYCRSVAIDFEDHFHAWVDRREEIFSSDPVGIVELFRAHCDKGITKIDIVETDWRYVELLVWNTENAAFLLAGSQNKGVWSAQVLPHR